MSASRGLERVIEQLQGLDALVDAPDAVTEILSSADLDAGCTSPYTRFLVDHYARNLVHRCASFELILVCWQPGQATPIHNHDGQVGWARVLHGRIEEVRYRLSDGRADFPEPGMRIDAPPAKDRVRLKETGRSVIDAGRSVVRIDERRAIHSLANPAAQGSQGRTVTLHVYSSPLDSCLVYDPESSLCERRTLVFDTSPDPLARSERG